MKKILAIACALLMTTIAFADKKQTEIIVAAASSLTDAMNELIVEYKKVNPDVLVTPTYGSSGSLQKQIEQGAPADVFFSAATKQMDALEKEGLIASGSRKDLLENSVVLVTPGKSTAVTSFEDAGTDKIKQIALGDPGSVPAGQYAAEVFESLGISAAVKAKAVYAKNVRQVLAYVESGDVDAGVVYSTDAAIAKGIRIAARAPAGSHRPVLYPAALVKESADKKAAKDFLAWLSGADAKAIFTRYGFTVK